MKIDYRKRMGGTIATLDGQIKYIETSNFLVDTGSHRLFGAFFRDVSEVKQIENELRFELRVI